MKVLPSYTLSVPNLAMKNQEYCNKYFYETSVLKACEYEEIGFLSVNGFSRGCSSLFIEECYTLNNNKITPYRESYELSNFGTDCASPFFIIFK